MIPSTFTPNPYLLWSLHHKTFYLEHPVRIVKLVLKQVSAVRVLNLFSDFFLIISFVNSPPSDFNKSNAVWLKHDMWEASIYGMLNIKNRWADWRLFALKFPVLLVFAMTVVISTWQPIVDSIMFKTIATPRLYSVSILAGGWGMDREGKIHHSWLIVWW